MSLVLFRYVEAGTLMNNYAHIFDLLTRLRQVNFIIPSYRYILFLILITSGEDLLRQREILQKKKKRE